jgi:hypothetical protein
MPSPSIVSAPTGTPKVRAGLIAVGLAILTGDAVLWLGVNTLLGLYHGPPYPTSATLVDGTATPGACRAVGPVSGYGFGRYWDCDVTVRLTDGRTVHARSARSTVVPADAAAPRAVRVACEEDEGDEAEPCSVYRGGNIVLGALVRLAIWLNWLLAAGLVLIGGMLLLGGLAGGRLFQRLFTKPYAGIEPDELARLRGYAEAPVEPPITDGRGVLRIVLVKPEWVVGDAYGDQTPVIAFEHGGERTEFDPGAWGVHDVPAPAGDLRVVAWTPRIDGPAPRRVSEHVFVPAGAANGVVYRPASVPELGGTLRELDDELSGDLAFGRLVAALALLGGLGWLVYRLVV